MNPRKATPRGVLLALALAAAVVVELAAAVGAFARIEAGWGDLRHRLAGVRHWPQHVALVVIDDVALNLYKDDPLAFWTPQMAQAAERLRQVGAKIVGIDFLFSVSPEAWLAKMLPAGSRLARSYDGPLRAAINSGHVVLVAAQNADPQSGFDRFLLPDRSFLMAVPDFDFPGHIGLANLPPDADGVVRHFTIAPRVNLAPGEDAALLPRYSFSPLMAAHAAGGSREGATWNIGGRSRDVGAPQDIVYSGPPGTVPRISLSRLLAADALADPLVRDLAGKVAIVGGEFHSMGDTHLTPYGTGAFGGEGAIMTGAEVQANIVETLLAGLTQRPVPAPLGAVLSFVFAVLGAALWQAPQLRRAIGLAALAFAVLAASYLAFLDFRLLAVAPPLAAMLAAFAAHAAYRHAPSRRHRDALAAALGAHVGSGDIGWLASARRPLPQGWENYPAAVLALALPPADVAAGEQPARAAAVEALRDRLRRRGVAVSAGEGQMLFAYFGWPRPAANVCADALAALAEVRATLPAGTGVGLDAGETAFCVDAGTVIAAGESVAAAAGLAHLAAARGDALASRRLLHAAGREPPAAAPTVWQNGSIEVPAYPLDEEEKR